MIQNLSQKQKFAFYLPSELRSQIDRWYSLLGCTQKPLQAAAQLGYTSDDCASVNEFILKSVQFYLSHLTANENNPLLPTATSSAIEGRLGVFEDRMARLMFKQAVELAMVEAILVEQLEVGKADLGDLRKWCVDIHHLPAPRRRRPAGVQQH